VRNFCGVPVAAVFQTAGSRFGRAEVARCWRHALDEWNNSLRGAERGGVSPKPRALKRRRLHVTLAFVSI
jgi:hypothetical protein